MDWTAIITSAITAIMGIGAVAAFAAKVLPKATKYVGIATDALELASVAIKALDDGNISAQELTAIKADYVKLLADFKA